jgi:hypothetical protein
MNANNKKRRMAPATRRREPAVFIARIERNNERAL